MWLLAIAAASASDCEVEDRPRMLVFPVTASAEGDPAVVDLVREITDGLVAVDYPLIRFHNRLLGGEPQVEGDVLVGASDPASAEGVRCAELAVVPRLTALEHLAQPPNHSVKLTLELDLYQRNDQGQLARTHTLSASAPGLVDTVEDAMTAARRSTVDQVTSKIPVSKKKLETGKAALDSAIAVLPSEQAAAAQEAVDQAGLAVTRVASIARLPVLVPAVGDGMHRTANGLKWRATEDQCYLDPPKPEDADADERNLECAALNRARQAVRQVQLDTRKVPGLRLEAIAMRSGSTIMTPLDRTVDVRVGDGFRVLRDGQRIGYARVRRVGTDGWAAPTELQRIVGVDGDVAGLVVEEDPRLGIEIGGHGGLTTAARLLSPLPPDPITGEARNLPGGIYLPTGVLRFDVNLGRTTGLYEWWQTNRIEIGQIGPLSVKGAQFGMQRRLLVVRRLYGLVGLSGGITQYSVPAGVTKLNDDGEPVEVRAGSSSLVGAGELGLQVMVTPALSLQLTGGFRVGQRVQELSWTVDEATSGTVVLENPISPTGTQGGLSAAWTF
jgi:hypothetical protein